MLLIFFAYVSRALLTWHFPGLPYITMHLDFSCLITPHYISLHLTTSHTSHHIASHHFALYDRTAHFIQAIADQGCLDPSGIL